MYHLSKYLWVWNGKSEIILYARNYLQHIIETVTVIMLWPFAENYVYDFHLQSFVS